MDDYQAGSLIVAGRNSGVIAKYNSVIADAQLNLDKVEDQSNQEEFERCFIWLVKEQGFALDIFSALKENISRYQNMTTVFKKEEIEDLVSHSISDRCYETYKELFENDRFDKGYEKILIFTSRMIIHEAERIANDSNGNINEFYARNAAIMSEIANLGDILTYCVNKKVHSEKSKSIEKPGRKPSSVREAIDASLSDFENCRDEWKKTEKRVKIILGVLNKHGKDDFKVKTITKPKKSGKRKGESIERKVIVDNHDAPNDTEKNNLSLRQAVDIIQAHLKKKSG